MSTDGYFGRCPTSLSSDILIHCIFPYISSKHLFASLSKQIRNTLLLIEAAPYWNEKVFSFCIDSSCFNCPLKMPLASQSGALSVIANIPYKNVKIHCLITDIPSCLECFSKRGLIEKLSLTVTNKSDSLPLHDLIPDRLDSSMFQNLKTLILDSSHLQHIQPAGRIRLLKIIGTKLTSLSFIGLSPTKMFILLNNLCPMIKMLRVDRVMSPEGLDTYCNQNIEELVLYRTNFLLSFPLALSNLKILKFSANCRYALTNYAVMIHQLPPHLIQLELEIPSDEITEIMKLISSALLHLEILKLTGSYVKGMIGSTGITSLITNCIKLKSFEVTSIKSVDTISFDENTFRIFGSSRSLSRLRVHYEENVLQDLFELLRRTTSIREIILEERSRWSTIPWEDMLKSIDAVSSTFPEVTVTLEDIS